MNFQEFRTWLTEPKGAKLPSLREARNRLEARTLTVGADGELVPADAEAEFTVKLYDRLTDYSAAIDAGVMLTPTPNGADYPVIVTVDQPKARRVGEDANTTETSNITFARITLGAYKYTAQTVISNELMQDSYLEDFIDEVTDKLAEAIAREIDPLIIGGSGTNEPQGLVQNVEVGAISGNNINPDHFFDLSTSLDPAYFRGEKKDQLRWLMSVEAYREVAEFSTTGAGDASEASRATSDDDPLYLWGYPVVLSDNMSVGTSRGDTIALFGYFGRAYKARATPLRDDVSTGALFDQDAVAVRSVVRMDGKVRDREAVKALVRGPGAVIDSFAASDTTPSPGDTITLTWATTGADRVLVNGTVQAAVDGSATVTIPANADIGLRITFDIEARFVAEPSLTSYGSLEVTVTA